jgi:hypothetical protein
VSVGVELLAKPSILFLDEPSSGLDPATEFSSWSCCAIWRIPAAHYLHDARDGNAYLLDQLIVLVGGVLAFQARPRRRGILPREQAHRLYERLADRPPPEWRSDLSLARVRRRITIPRLAACRCTSRAVPLPWASCSSANGRFSAPTAQFPDPARQPLLIAALVSWVTITAVGDVLRVSATLWFGCSNAAQEIVKEIAIYRRERLIGVSATLTSRASSCS